MAECPKCNYERKPTAAECPRCGIVYDKYENYINKKSISSEEKEELKDEKKNPETNIKNKKIILLISAPIVLLLLISYWFFTQPSGEFKRMTKVVLEEMKDLDNSFESGRINYIRFSETAFIISKKIAVLKREFMDDKKSLKKKEAQILGEIIAAEELIDLIDCIWENKIQRSQYSQDIPIASVSLCIPFDYTVSIAASDVKYNYLPYKKAYILLHAFHERVDSEETESFSNRDEIDALYSRYLLEVISMYQDSVINTQSLL